MERLKKLGEEESLFSNIDSLDSDFVPKILPFRESHQKMVAEAVEPLAQGKRGRNLLITGKSGIGKTHAVRRVLEEFREENDGVAVSHVNCWKKTDSKNILKSALKDLGYSVSFEIDSAAMSQKISESVKNRNGLVLVFDEVDKAEEYSFLYSLLEDLGKKSVILISNNRDWFSFLDDRIKSRLSAEKIEFGPYNERETKEILQERKKFAFFDGVWGGEAFEVVAEKTFELKDMRAGINLLREAGMNAEKDLSPKIEERHARKAVEKTG